MIRAGTISLALVTWFQATWVFAEPTLAEREQLALNEATASVADSVVQIRTVGGLDRVGRKLLSQGPTTGLIVSADGYIVSSAFNFAGRPSSILVQLASGEQLAAELVARDKNRMLVLLKIAAEHDLPVPIATPRDEIRVGQWAVALGRTFQSDQVGVSVGIVSALNRKYGRVIQTDANCSVANYGGPLVDVAGRVLGVLVPMSPESGGGAADSELAGAEYYDSGIGFAVPLEHVFGVLQRWRQGEDLLAGKLGIGLASGNAHLTPPKIVSVWPESPAAKAGWKAKDLITTVNGVQVETQAQLRFQIMPLYAGDSVNVVLQRGDEQLDTEVLLTGKLAPYRHAFLGILPARNPNEADPPGVVVRHVWPESPADKAGVVAGDRITQLKATKTAATTDARVVLAGMHPGAEMGLQVVRDDETLTLSAILASTPEDIPTTWPDVADATPASQEDDPNENNDENNAQQNDPNGKNLNGNNPNGNNPNGNNPNGNDPNAALEKLKLPEFSQEAVYFSPTQNRDDQLGMLLWLGDGDAGHNQSRADNWQAICRRDGLVLLIAPPEEAGTWKTDDLGYLQQLARAAMRRFNVDRRRLVIGGQGKAGQLAYALALKRRTSTAGIISVDAPLPRTVNVPKTSPRSQLAVLAIESRNSNFAPLIRRDIQLLRETGYPVTFLQRPATSDVTSEIDAATRSKLARWIDGLDRL